MSVVGLGIGTAVFGVLTATFLGLTISQSVKNSKKKTPPTSAGFAVGGLSADAAPDIISGGASRDGVYGVRQTEPIIAPPLPVGTKPQTYARLPTSGGPAGAGMSAVSLAAMKAQGGRSYDQASSSVVAYKTAFAQPTQLAKIDDMYVTKEQLRHLMSGKAKGVTNVVVVWDKCPACVKLKGMLNDLVQHARVQNLAMVSTDDAEALKNKALLDSQYVPRLYRVRNGKVIKNKVGGFGDVNELQSWLSEA